jgi:hypothetical protein
VITTARSGYVGEPSRTLVGVGDAVARVSISSPRPRGGGFEKEQTMARTTYHLVDLRGDGYRGGYLDTDARMLIACFKLFEEFYDDEYPGVLKWDRNVAREIEALHAWWKRGRRQTQKRAETLAREGQLRRAKFTKAPGSGVWKWDSKWRSAAAKRKWFAAAKKADAQDQKMLRRLIAIRERLWT